ncbi:transcriptional activator soma [Acrodontium crateriforme]|uniref:Transcriptional activator soma n=1 Tax=Acrodontium crateriforme TaxID=150365 RepID=A0AAQ3MCV0_9PEZI|nr:transcriptional activator soma [Acrodontium crateriforme]
MSNQQQMNMGAMGGPVGGGAAGQMNMGTPNSSGGVSNGDPLKRLNTAIYDYLLRNSLYDVARLFSKSVDIETDTKKSPNQRGGQLNGLDDMDIDKAIQDRPDDLPLPQQLGDGPFLQDWWCQFWEIYHGQRSKGKPTTLAYIGAQRQGQKARTNMMGPMDPAQMNNMRGFMPNMNNGMNMAKAMQNSTNMARMAQMKNMAASAQNNMMTGAPQMDRQGSQMDANGPRSGSPGSGDAPSPKRQRLDSMNQGRPGPPGQMPNNPVGPPLPSPTSIAQAQELLRQNGMDPNTIPPQSLHKLAMQPADRQSKSVETYSVSMQQQMKAALNNTQSNMNKGMPNNPNMVPGGPQGSPMSQAGMEGPTGEFYAASNGNRMASNGGPGGPGGGPGNANTNGNGSNHALQDYQMQLMLLEQQNKKRLLMARQEQDNMGNVASGVNGQPFAPGLSPSGRAGDPSPNPNDMARGTPKIGKAGMSPNGDLAGRGSPQPGMINPNTIPPQMRDQLMQNGGMRPPSSHPMSAMNGMTPEQMRVFQQQGGQMMQNGMWAPGQQPPGGMMPGQAGGHPGQVNPNMTPRQASQMGPPPPPQSGTQPSSPSQQPAAPPTPSQTTKAKPPTKKESAKKAAAAKKAGAANAAANANNTTESEQPPTPTPATPITPLHNDTFRKGQPPMPNGQPQPNPMQNNPQGVNNPMQPGGPGPDMNGPFGGSLGDSQFNMDNMLDFSGDLNGTDVLDSFDFDSFLTSGEVDGGLGGNFAFDAFGGDGSIEAGGDMN